MLPKMVGAVSNSLPETEAKLLPSLVTIAVCDTAPSGTVPFFHDRPVSEERHPSFELSPFGRISDNPSSLSPNVLGLRGVSKVEAEKGSKTASASCVGT